MHVHSITTALGGLATVAALLALAGCGDSRVSMQAGPTFSPADFGVPEQACLPNGFVIFEEGTAAERFPTALAVARLGRIEGQGPSQVWTPAKLKPEQAVYWNSLFDGLPAIREVIVMDERTPGPTGPGAPTLAATAGRLNAGLCLVYGPAAATGDEAALIGTLLDTRDGHTLACIQARATQADFQPQRLDAPRGDERNVDLKYLVARKFERQVRLCVTELVSRSSPPVVGEDARGPRDGAKR
jgi:hypothetical protein